MIAVRRRPVAQGGHQANGSTVIAGDGTANDPQRTGRGQETDGDRDDSQNPAR